MLTPVDIEELLTLPDTELRSKLQELLPYRPETLYLAPATHPDYGEVHVISTKVGYDGEVTIIFLRKGKYSAQRVCVPINSLTFTKPPEPAKPTPRQLVTLEDIENAPDGITVRGSNSEVCEKFSPDWYEIGRLSSLTSHDMLNITPLTVLEPVTDPAAPAKPAHPEWWGWE